MTRFEQWFLRRILRKEVRQGFDHFRNTVGLYEMIRDAWYAEFTEDNAATISKHLSECFEATQVWPQQPPGDDDVHKDDSMVRAKGVVVL